MTKKLFIPSDSDRYDTDPNLLGIEDFGEKIGGARKDLYAHISKNLASGKINYDQLIKAGTRKDVILLAYYAKFYDIPDEYILSLITENDYAEDSTALLWLRERAKYTKLKVGRFHSYFRLTFPLGLWNIAAQNVETFLKLAQKGIYIGSSISVRPYYRIFTSRRVELGRVRVDDALEEEVADTFARIAERILQEEEKKEEERKATKGITGWDKVKLKLRFGVLAYKSGEAVIYAYNGEEKTSGYFGSGCIPILLVQNTTPDTREALLRIADNTNGEEEEKHKELCDRAIKIINQLPPYSPKVKLSHCLTSRIRGAGLYIGYCSAREWHILKELDAFRTSSESLKFLCDNFVDIYTTVYNIINKREEPYEPYHENVGSCAYRKGPDWRNGRNATENDFLKVFGFRGVEFGNYVTQKERQPLMNKTYDALRDMCNILELEPRIVGLGGRLGLAFGARGRGGKGAAAAHYEPFYNVINLTRPRGAGCLAHEWFHALDHNFVANRELFPDQYFNDWNGEKARYFTSLSTHCFYEVEMLRPFVGVDFANWEDPWYRRSHELQDHTGKKQNGKGYWTQPTEVGARCFEAYVRYKLKKQGWQNDFLSCLHYAHRHYPYPKFFNELDMVADAPEDLKRLESYFERLLNSDILSKVLGEKFTAVPVTTASAASTIETTDNSPSKTLTDTQKDEAPKDDDEEEERTQQSEPNDEDVSAQKRKEEVHKFFAEFLIRFQKTKWAKNE